MGITVSSWKSPFVSFTILSMVVCFQFFFLNKWIFYFFSIINFYKFFILNLFLVNAHLLERNHIWSGNLLKLFPELWKKACETLFYLEKIKLNTDIVCFYCMLIFTLSAYQPREDIPWKPLCALKGFLLWRDFKAHQFQLFGRKLMSWFGFLLQN